MAYGVAHTTNLSGCDIYDFQSTQDIENGSLVTMGDLIAGERNIYEAKVPATATLNTEVAYLVANPAWDYDDCKATNQNEENYINKAGVAFRGFELKPHKKFKVTSYSIDPIDGSTALAAGQYVGLQNGSTKMKASATAPTDSAFIGKIIAVDTVGFAYCIGSGGAANGDLGYTVSGPDVMALVEVVKNSAGA